MATEYSHTRPRVPAVVSLFDAEGLTTELGLMVAAQQHQIMAYGRFLTQRDEVEKQIQKLKEQAERAAADHDAWLATAELEHIDTPCSVAASCSAYDRDHAISSRGLKKIRPFLCMVWVCHCPEATMRTLALPG